MKLVDKAGAFGIQQNIRLLIADDHPAIRDALGHFFAGEDGIELIGSASDGEQALRLAETRCPDVAVLDIRMPRLGGIETLRRLNESPSPPSVILYTGNPDRGLLVESLDLGARGFLAKEAPLVELARAIRMVAEGGTYVDPMLGGSLVTPDATSKLTALSKREREVLRLLADGMRNEDVGVELFISALTVKTHVKHAMVKLEADTRTQAVASALRQALIV